MLDAATNKTHFGPGKKKLLGNLYHSLPTHTFTCLSVERVCTLGSVAILLSSTKISSGAWYAEINGIIIELTL